MSWLNKSRHTFKIRGADNRRRVYPPGARVPELDHPRLQAAADNGELVDLNPPPPPKEKPKVKKAEPPKTEGPAETITEAVEAAVGEPPKVRRKRVE